MLSDNCLYKGELTTLRKSLDNEDKIELSARITAIVCYIIALTTKKHVMS